MAIKTTTWWPDTHPDTRIDYSWDTAVAPEQRVHTPVAATLRGVVQDDFVAAHDKVVTENQRKNHAVDDLIQNAAGANLDPTMVGFEVSEAGVVTLTVRGLAQGAAKAAAAAIKAKHGANVALVVV